MPDGLGRGNFTAETAEILRNMADPYGILVLDKGHTGDLVRRVLSCLQTMLGDVAARDVVAKGTGKRGNAEASLRKYFSGKFFSEHITQYRKRPVYWLLQSPKKKYGIWLFQEKLTRDTLYRIRGEEYVAAKIRLLELHKAELAKKREGAAGHEQRQMDKEIADIEEILDDVREFAQRIDGILQRGYTPHIDDGVLINIAPLWPLVPGWKKEPKDCWKKLEKGDYDWSHQAMDLWPERVKEKCKQNKSFRIAHGME